MAVTFRRAARQPGLVVQVGVSRINLLPGYAHEGPQRAIEGSIPDAAAGDEHGDSGRGSGKCQWSLVAKLIHCLGDIQSADDELARPLGLAEFENHGATESGHVGLIPRHQPIELEEARESVNIGVCGATGRRPAE